MVLVVLIALGVGGGLVGSRYAQIDRDSDLLLQELDALQAAEDDYIAGKADSRAALDEVLDRTVCATEQCQKIESGTKSYVADLVACLDDYTELNEDERLANIFMPQNIAADGPEFEESIAYLESMRKKFENVHARFADLLTDDMLKSYMRLDDMDFVTRAVRWAICWRARSAQRSCRNGRRSRSRTMLLLTSASRRWSCWPTSRKTGL